LVPVPCTIGTGSFPGVKYGRGLLLTTHTLLMPWSWKSRAVPLPTLWTTPKPVTGTLYLYPSVTGKAYNVTFQKIKIVSTKTHTLTLK